MIVFNSEEFGELIARAAGASYRHHHDVSIARIAHGDLLGGVVFSNYTRYSIQIHSSGFQPNWVNRDLLWCVFNYPFNQLAVRCLIGQVAAHNKPALKFNLNLGFKEVARIPDVYGGPLGKGIACVVMQMYREDCRFLKWPRRPDVVTYNAKHHTPHPEEVQYGQV